MYEAKEREREEFTRLLTDARYKPEISRRQTSLCRYLKIRSGTYYRWMKVLGGHGDFDLQEFLSKNKQKLAKALIDGIDGKKTNSNLLKLFAVLTGDYGEKKEETNHEPTPADYIKIARITRDSLRDEVRDSKGCCPFGNQCAVFHETRLSERREQQQEDSMAAVGLSA